jgi:AAA family ATPase
MTIEPTVDFERLSAMVGDILLRYLFILMIVQTEGCSGAELAAMCQEAAMIAMREDVNAAYVSNDHFLRAAKVVRRGITSEMIEKYRSWREQSGLSEA